jgi:hypothetical protein
VNGERVSTAAVAAHASIVDEDIEPPLARVHRGGGTAGRAFVSDVKLKPRDSERRSRPFTRGTSARPM